MELVIINQPRVFPYRREYHIAKRVMDVTLGLLALFIALPLMVICAVAILLDSPGPVLFIQERIGKGGHPFRMFKFRTMKHQLDNSSHRAFMKAFVNGQIGGDGNGKNDGFPGTFRKAFTSKEFSGNGNGNGKVYKPIQASQVTRVGSILRKTSLDELPQLINVLKGEMSLVGPRPNVPWEVEEYWPWHHERLEVLPGITGLAQVQGRSSVSFDSIVKYDIEYVEKQSLALDLKILWWTAIAATLGIGAE